MADDNPPATAGLSVICGERSDGSPVWEELLVRDLGGGEWELQATPGLVDGVARGDVVRDLGEGRFELVRRGGHLAIHVWGDVPAGLDEVADQVRRLGGVHDGCAGRSLTIFSIPVAAGFPQVEHALSVVCDRYPDLGWSYGNVYADPDDPSTPLNWWL